MVRKKGLTLGIDCGGTNLKMAIVEQSGRIVQSKSESIEFKDDPQAVKKVIISKIKKFVRQSKAGKFHAIGMGIAGDVDQKQGLVRFSPNMGWRNVSLKEELYKEFKVPFLIENDANCAAWGAYCLDADRNCENLICLTLGTGIGGGIVIHKKLYRGSSGSAGELGHMSIQYNGRPCKCGSFGCIESMVGARGIIASAEEALRKGLAPILKKLLERSPKKELDPKLIADAAEQGDEFCQHLWNETGERFGAALSNLINIFNPDRIVLSGGVSKAWPLFRETTLHTIGVRAFASAAQKVIITVSEYEERLGVVGAALLFWE